MVNFPKHLFHLLLIVVLTSTNIEARESKFFSKATRKTNENNDVVLDALLLAPSPAPGPAAAVSGEEGYGLYGHVADNGRQNDVNTEKFGESYNQEETTDPYKYKGYKSNEYSKNEYDGYANEKLGTSDTRFMENGKYYNDNVENVNNYNNGYEEGEGVSGKSVEYNSNSPNGDYTKEKLGMSNTRFSESGKYYNNFENMENYDNRYRTEKGISGASDGYYSNSENHEFDTMEEYEKQQGYPEIEGEFTP